MIRGTLHPLGHQYVYVLLAESEVRVHYRSHALSVDTLSGGSDTIVVESSVIGSAPLASRVRVPTVGAAWCSASIDLQLDLPVVAAGAHPANRALASVGVSVDSDGTFRKFRKPRKIFSGVEVLDDHFWFLSA